MSSGGEKCYVCQSCGGLDRPCCKRASELQAQNSELRAGLCAAREAIADSAPPCPHEARVVELEAALAAEKAAHAETKRERDTIQQRISRMDRYDLDDPASYCLNALAEGEISTSKVFEWLRKYLLTGEQDPIKQGIMRSGGAEQSLADVIRERDALVAAIEKIGAIACWDENPIDARREICSLVDRAGSEEILDSHNAEVQRKTLERVKEIVLQQRPNKWETNAIVLAVWEAIEREFAPGGPEGGAR